MLNSKSLAEQEIVNIVQIIINVIALFLNVVLIYVTTKTPNRSKDINVILGLSVVDMLLPIITIITGVSNYVGASDSMRLSSCLIKGPFDFCLLIVSVLMVSITAIQRYVRVLAIKIPTWTWAVFYGYSLSCILLIFISALMGKFGVSAGGIDCTPDPKSSVLSRVVLTLLGLSFLIYLSITLFCYVSIMIYATSILRGEAECIELKRINAVTTGPTSKRRTITTRTLLMSAIYLLLLAPSGFLIILEANSLLPENESYSLAISVLTSSISLANPFLVLFVHAVIYGQLVKTIKSLLSKVISFPSAHQAL